MRIALIGNQNAGKTTLFNALTGAGAHVGNFPGVTVERREGKLRDEPGVTLIDLPGAYSLRPYTFEERVALDFLLLGQADAVLNVVDASNLPRNLYLTLQLLSLGLPVVVVLSFLDEARDVDANALSAALGVPVMGARDPALPKYIAGVTGDGAKPSFPEAALDDDETEALIIRRYARIDAICAGIRMESPAQRRTRIADSILTHRLLAFPIFFAAMAFVFYLTFGPVGGGLGALLREGCDWLMEWFGRSQITPTGATSEFLRGLVVDGAIAGAFAVLSFLPGILTLFFLLSLLEDSGYMARMAFVTDALLRRLGLSGRSFVPALLGFGCSVSAIMACRALPTARDRKLTIALIPFLSCSAKLPIYAAFAGAFFGRRAVLVTTALYALGVLLAIPAALVYSRLAFPGEGEPFIMELPAYRLPTLKNALRHTLARAASFVRVAITILPAASMLVWLLSRGGEASPLAWLGRTLAPMFLPLGFADWRLVAALLAGLTAKESVLSALSVLLSASTAASLSAALVSLLSPLSAFSFLVFAMLYMPCVASFAAAKRELGSLRGAALLFALQTCVAWAVALILYNIGRVLGFA